jgi:hypothetical protein
MKPPVALRLTQKGDDTYSFGFLTFSLFLITSLGEDGVGAIVVGEDFSHVGELGLSRCHVQIHDYLK